MVFRRAALTPLVALAGLCAAAAPAAAYTWLETAYGSPMIGLSTKALAMAGAVTAIPDGSFALVQNPAMMSWESRNLADLTLRAVRYDETRFVPLYDTFDSFVRETAVAENPSTYTALNGGFVVHPFENKNISLGGGFYERYNMQFDFVDERRGQEVDDIRATQTITSSKSIYSATGGASYREDVLSFGASIHYYFGDLELNNATVPGEIPQSPEDDLNRDYLLREVSGISGSFGVAAEVDERVTLAASYNLPVNFDVDWRRETLNSSGGDTTLGNDDVDYPGRLSVGIAYRPRNSLRTTFSLDVSRTFWEDLEDPILEANPLIEMPSLRNTYEYRFGLEHIFYNDLPARIGFFYREAYAADELDDAGIAFGTGYRWENWDIGIGIDVTKRNSRQESITPRSSLDPEGDRVQDSLLRGAVDVRFKF